MRRASVLLACLAVAAGCGDEKPKPAAASVATATTTPVTTSTPPSRCRPARVRRAPYPGHGKGLETLPWISGRPRSTGLVGLVWFWSPRWSHVRRARIWAGGRAPEGYNTKMLWVFLGDDAVDGAGDELRVSGRRLDGPGRFADSFAGIGYEGSDGAPSYASIIDIPRPGCWRLTLTSGTLRATVDMRAIRLR
jgi:hypothetical protein